MNKFLFNRTLIIGMGLIGSSLSLALKHKNVSKYIIGYDNKNSVRKICIKKKIVNNFLDNLNQVKNFDLIILCSPLSTYSKILKKIIPQINVPSIITDVGSTKRSVIKEFEKYKKNKLIEFVPGHPIAGLEKSGPNYGFKDLFKDRYCILTPEIRNTKGEKKIKNLWNKVGMTVDIMDAHHHDRVLAMTSHIPQLIAYSIVATSTELEKNIKDEVIRYSASGFRDFTRLAGSDPTMWRDIYSQNKDAVLEMLGRFSEDLSSLQKAIRNNDLEALENVFKATRRMRQKIEKAGQAGTFDPRENN